MLLSNESIAQAVEEVRGFLTGSHVEKQKAAGICLSVEEVLLEYRDRLGGDAEFELMCRRRFGCAHVTIRVKGAPCDPLADKTGEIPLWFLMDRIDERPSWRYARGHNLVRFGLVTGKRSRSLQMILGSVLLGAVMGLIARSLPGDVLRAVCDGYLTPVTNAILGLLGTLSTILIFVSIVAGISGMGDIATFNRVGKRMLLRFTLMLLVGTAGCALLCVCAFPIGGGGGSGFDFAAIWQMILGIVPTNIFETFLSGNALQIVFLAIFTGVILLTLATETANVIDFNMAANIIIQRTLQIVIKLMPIVVFISVFKFMAGDTASGLSGVWKYPVLVAVGCAVMLAAFVARACVTQRVRPSVLMRKLLPTFLIALTTASSSAAFSVNMDTCVNELGMDRQVAEIGVPLGQTLFKPVMIFVMACGSCCMAQLYGVALPLPALITLLFSVFVFAFAAPPVPGALISCFTMLFAQLGIPVEAVSVIVAMDVIIDHMGTATNLSLLQLELTQQAAALNKLDRGTLRSVRR